MMNGQPVETDLAIPPGDFLKDELDAREMSQRELADRLGRPVQVINEIINSKKAITEETALALERVLGVSAPFWLSLETRYQLARARVAERHELEGQTAWLKQFPVAEMEKRAWIPSAHDRVEKVRALLQFFGVASFAALPGRQSALGLRLSAKATIDEYALLAWVRRGEIEGEALETSDYDVSAFREVIQDARGMTRMTPQEALPVLMKRCAKAGVAFAVIPELPKVGANGVARWLTKSKALIQLNLRYRWADVFWFSFFHECGHVVSHQQRRVFVDLAQDHRSDVEETEADVFAEQTLIPKEWWAALLEREFRDPAVILDFAEECGIGPGIVVGRLQKERLLPWTAHPQLKPRFVWTERA